MKIEFKEVEHHYVAERLFYNESFNLFFYLDDGDLTPVTSFRDFTEVVANGLKIYKQSTKFY